MISSLDYTCQSNWRLKYSFHIKERDSEKKYRVCDREKIRGAEKRRKYKRDRERERRMIKSGTKRQIDTKGDI